MYLVQNRRQRAEGAFSYRIGMRVGTWLAGVLLLLAFTGARGVPEPGPQIVQKTSPQRPQSPFDDDVDHNPAFSHKQLRAMNAERQKDLVADTNRLLKLAKELNAELEAAGSETLTPDQIRKVARIEKLARSVREKMILTVGGGSPFRGMFTEPTE